MNLTASSKKLASQVAAVKSTLRHPTLNTLSTSWSVSQYLKKKSQRFRGKKMNLTASGKNTLQKILIFQTFFFSDRKSKKKLKRVFYSKNRSSPKKKMNLTASENFSGGTPMFLAEAVKFIFF